MTGPTGMPLMAVRGKEGTKAAPFMWTVERDRIADQRGLEWYCLWRERMEGPRKGRRYFIRSGPSKANLFADAREYAGGEAHEVFYEADPFEFLDDVAKGGTNE